MMQSMGGSDNAVFETSLPHHRTGLSQVNPFNSINAIVSAVRRKDRSESRCPAAGVASSDYRITPQLAFSVEAVYSSAFNRVL